ncbi:alkaline phosphatase family protein [Streptomyces sp. NBC_00124]|uniref:alkaline phosphatase D family protein n=1 Tax=Streptomyces sp. NBC_00124 TaxID=2975662 RepID=UPI00225599A6|nr:alkaline phosphatase D family protein [Streptomyces sp. NBC_00124]MCX5363980.1 alkaline phosphatase family protein [Streptomyces sp. NBC_00124]
MAELRLGPLLRYADGSSATVWVEASRPCAAEVRCAGGAGGKTQTFQVSGHHYALVPVTGLTPGTSSSYEVLLDGVRVWPLPDSPFPDSVIRTPADGDTVRVAFGSCRWAAPPHGEPDPVGIDALDTLAARIATDPDRERPDVLLLLGDQVYADETSPATRRWLAARRDLSDPPGSEVADYEEYTHLYYESWLDPEIRWLLSTVPSCMIFDDHDVIDDWNTSAAWVEDMRATPWWRERVLSGLMSYWVHQHLGNLSPAELDSDPLYAALRETPDGTDELRAFACRADVDPASVRWSYRRDFGRVRLVMVDSRAARVLDEENRSMLDPGEARWVREQVLDGPGSYDHLLIGTSLPWLLPHLVHDAEAWNAALCRGERGARWARFGEDLRRRADLEHWAAFPASFEALVELIAEAGSGPEAPATVCVLSGDVHHAYIAEPRWPEGSGPDARVLQLTCSPVHNSIPLSIRLGFRFGWSAVGRFLGRRFAGHGACPQPSVDWRRTGGPWFGNQLMTLTMRGRSAELRLEQARAVRGGKARLAVVSESVLSEK